MSTSSGSDSYARFAGCASIATGPTAYAVGYVLPPQRGKMGLVGSPAARYAGSGAAHVEIPLDKLSISMIL